MSLADGAVIEYTPALLPSGLLKTVREEVSWQQRHVTMYGKTIPIPRLTAWYGVAPYTYSGIINDPLEWTPTLLSIKESVERFTGHVFNSALLNYYRDGKDSISWHADDEKELGERPLIASVSLGATRTFLLRHNDTKVTQRFELGDGSLLVMGGTCQEHYQHSLPKRANAKERINITFRRL